MNQTLLKFGKGNIMALVKSKFAYDKNNFREEDTQTKPTIGHGKCVIYGCERDGHINAGQWNCRYHFNVPADRLHEVTTALRQHEHLVNWYERLIAANEVEWLFGVGTKIALKNKAPVDCEPLEAETFSDYRNRIGRKLFSLLAYQKTPPNLSYKTAAANDFNELEEVIF